MPRKFWKSRSKTKAESKKPPTQSPPPTPVPLPPSRPHPLPVRIGQHRSAERTTTTSSPPSLAEMKQWTAAKTPTGERGAVQIGRGRVTTPPSSWTPGTMPQGTERGPALMGRRRGVTPPPLPQIPVPQTPVPQTRGYTGGGYNPIDYTGIHESPEYQYRHEDEVSTDDHKVDYTGVQDNEPYNYKYGNGNDDQKTDYTGVQDNEPYNYKYGNGGDGYTGVQESSDQGLVEEKKSTGGRSGSTANLLDLPAVRQHRAWMISKLRKNYTNELTEQRSDLVSAVNETAQLIRDYVQVIATLRQIPNDDNPFALHNALAVLAPTSPVRKAQRVHVALELAEKQLAKHLEKVRREELPITEDGTVDTGALSTRMVEYDDESAQQRSTVLVGGGKLFRSDESKTPVDTAKSVTHQTGPGAEIFVVSETNEIHMASHKLGKFHHSSLLGGKPVSMAGEMKVTAGKIDWISNKSGHYAPSKEQLLQFLYHLGKDGVPLTFEVKGMGKAAYKPGTTAAQVVAGIGSDGTEVAKFGHDHAKTQSVLAAWKTELGKPAFKKVFADNGWRCDHYDDVYEVEDKKTGKTVPGKAIRDAFKRAYPGRQPREEIQL